MSPDTRTPSLEESRTAPARGIRLWLALLLVASLAFNLVIIGAALAERIWSEPRERVGIHRSAHLLPRQFFVDLDPQRRDELTEVFRVKRLEFREERQALRGAASAFADALEHQPYDPIAAQSAIAEHASRSHRLIDLGVTVAEDLVEALTPEERQILAQTIRHRLEERRSRRSR
jgi:Spy/CpxP family protein refolding chaperone